ncbi:hypothetical protein, partial [Shewanella vaxholmensis]
VMVTFGEANYNVLPCCLKITLERSTDPSNTEKLCLSESSVITSFFINPSDSGIVLPLIAKATFTTALGNTSGCTKESTNISLQ